MTLIKARCLIQQTVSLSLAKMGNNVRAKKGNLAFFTLGERSLGWSCDLGDMVKGLASP